MARQPLLESLTLSSLNFLSTSTLKPYAPPRGVPPFKKLPGHKQKKKWTLLIIVLLKETQKGWGKERMVRDGKGSQNRHKTRQR